MLSYSSVRDEEAPKRGVDARFIIAADQLPETNTRETTKHTHKTHRERERRGKWSLGWMDGWMLYTTAGTSHSISLSYI